MPEKISLQEAMLEVLRGKDWLSFEDVARRIAARDLYRRPSDGRHVDAGQLEKRVKQSKDLFEVDGNKIRSAPR